MTEWNTHGKLLLRVWDLEDRVGNEGMQKNMDTVSGYYRDPFLNPYYNQERRLKRWDEGRWGKGNNPQYSRIYNRDPLAHLALSHFLSPLIEWTRRSMGEADYPKENACGCIASMKGALSCLTVNPKETEELSLIIHVLFMNAILVEKLQSNL